MKKIGLSALICFGLSFAFLWPGLSSAQNIHPRYNAAVQAVDRFEQRCGPEQLGQLITRYGFDADLLHLEGMPAALAANRNLRLYDEIVSRGHLFAAKNSINSIRNDIEYKKTLRGNRRWRRNYIEQQEALLRQLEHPVEFDLIEDWRKHAILSADWLNQSSERILNHEFGTDDYSRLFAFYKAWIKPNLYQCHGPYFPTYYLNELLNRQREQLPEQDRFKSIEPDWPDDVREIMAIEETALEGLRLAVQTKLSQIIANDLSHFENLIEEIYTSNDNYDFFARYLSGDPVSAFAMMDHGLYARYRTRAAEFGPVPEEPSKYKN